MKTPFKKDIQLKKGVFIQFIFFNIKDICKISYITALICKRKGRVIFFFTGNIFQSDSPVTFRGR